MKWIKDWVNEFPCKEIYTFLGQNLQNISLGKYYLDKQIYVNIEEYDTKLLIKGMYESHKKYLDLQYMISGKEKIIIKPVKELERNAQYTLQNDCQTYHICKGNEITLSQGQAILIQPQDGHISGIQIEQGLKVRKAVFKIPLPYFHNIKYFFMDVDGTLTNGSIYIDGNGECCKQFNVKDGYGISNLLKKNNVVPIIITGRNSIYAEKRAAELGITHIYQNVKDKKEFIIKFTKEMNIDLAEVAYIGDDLNDLAGMELVKKAGGLVGCPVDADDAVKEIADYISGYEGGNGAVRDFINWILLL